MKINSTSSAITLNPRIQGGLPILSGTRVTILEILGCLADGWTIEKIEKELNKSGEKINRSQILEAISYTTKFVSG